MKCAKCEKVTLPGRFLCWKHYGDEKQNKMRGRCGICGRKGHNSKTCEQRHAMPMCVVCGEHALGCKCGGETIEGGLEKWDM